MPENKVIWEIDVGAIISAGTPKGAATRLANLDYFDEEPTDEMTDDLREAITSFQADSENLDINGELDGATSAQLREQHDCEAEEADAPDSADGVAADEPEPTGDNA